MTKKTCEIGPTMSSPAISAPPVAGVQCQNGRSAQCTSLIP